ncbi:unnamed protein product [Scytosiphon promiscuus]
MQSWKTKVICAGRYRPRQFEYHPLHEDVVVFGTLRGEAVVADVASNSVCSSIPSGLSKDKHDSILGLCWLKQSPSRFVVGSSHGHLRLCDAGAMPSVGARAQAAAEGLELRNHDFTSRSNAVQEAVPFNGATATASASPLLGGATAGNGQVGMDDRFSEAGRIVTEFEQFEKLTSVHINSSDDQMLASGYTYGVKLYDLGTGQVIRAFEDIHEDHINISRFANHSPFVFATSSFDKTVKAWDSRIRPDNSPIYTCNSEMGHVMLSFSPDDVFLLTSAVDNEVKQYLALDGRLHMNLDVPKTGLDENFTRSYYTSSGRLILSGSSEEQTVRLYCAQTGRLIHSAEMYPGRKHGSLYVQSLRGDPHHDFQFSVLVNYRDTAYPLEIVNVDMLQGTEGEDLSSLTAYASSTRLSADLGRACVEKQGADVFLVARDRSRFPAHKAIVSCRSDVLGGLVARAEEAAKLLLRGATGGDSVDGGAGPGTCPARANGEEGVVKASVCLPRAVAPEIAPVILAFLYTDRLDPNPENAPAGLAEEYIDPEIGEAWSVVAAPAVATESCRSRGRSGFVGYGEGVGPGSGVAKRRENSPDVVAGSPSKVTFYEKVLEAAGALGLERLRSLVEWECRQLVNTTTVLSVAAVAVRQGTEQLLKYCVHYLGTHRTPVLELHGLECLPSSVHAQVEEERRRHVYALNGDSHVSRNPVGGKATPPTTPSGARANGDGAVIATTNANEATGTTAPGVGWTGAVHPSWGNDPDDERAQGGEGLPAVAVNPDQPVPENGNGGAGIDEAEVEGDIDGAEQAPEPMEDEALFDESGGDDDDDDDDDEDDDDDDVDEDDDFVDEEVDEEDDDTSSDADTLSDDDEIGCVWMESSHGGGNLPAAVRRRLVPTVTGHTATAVLGSQMIVLGGGNKRQFHSCRHVPVYDPVERTWSKLSTRGNAPVALIYHSCTALEPPWATPRNLLVIGGSNSPRQTNANLRQNAQISVLDALTMEWHEPKIAGDPMGVRTRHTAVAVHADQDQHDRLAIETNDESLASHFEELTAEDQPCTMDYVQGKGRGKRRDFPRTPPARQRSQPRDFGGDTNIIIFGGFSPIPRHAFNDVVVLNVQRSSRGGAYSTLGGNTGGGSGNRFGTTALPSGSSFSSSSGRANPTRRRRHSRGKHPVFDSDSDDGSEADGGAGKREETSSGSRNGYRYRWVRPMVRGTPPLGRLAHSAAVARLVEGEGSNGAGQQTYMVVFGGVGTSSHFNDVHCLKCSSTRAFEWEKVFVRGRRPAKRYGHSMVPLCANSNSGTCGYAKLLLFGGTSGQHAFNDFSLLNVSWGIVDGRGGIVARWESLTSQVNGILPCPRSRQTVCQVNGELIVFGGSDEPADTHNAQHVSKEVDAFVFHMRPRLRRKVLAPAQGFGGGGGASSIAQLQPLPSQPRVVQDGPALFQWHERAMAKEVAAHMALVEAAQRRRAEAAEAAVGSRGALEVAASALDEIRGKFTTVHGEKSQSGERRQSSDLVPSAGARITAVWDAIPVAQPGRASPSSQWIALNKSPLRPYGVEVVWECIRPEVFVYEPGPEPPVVVRPVTIHKDMQTLIGNGKFSDIKFRFQAVDFALPTTPTNTAHYAIVPPPTPTLSPKSAPPSPCSSLTWSPRSRIRKGPIGGGGRGRNLTTASKLPQYPSETEGDGDRLDLAPALNGMGGAVEVRLRDGCGKKQSVVSRSSAGQDREASMPVSPLGEWTVLRPLSNSSSPLGSGHRSSGGGKRRFFGLSETAEAEIEAAASLAKRAERGGGDGGGTAGRDRQGAVAAAAVKSNGVGGQDCMDAHRTLLSLRSDPMRAMLHSGMKETFTTDVLVKDIRPPVFSALLTYIYTDTLQLQKPEDITELLVLANQYTLTDLLSLCEGFLQGVLDEENVSHLYHYADALAMPTFEHCCLTFILRNWRNIVRTGGWMQLPAELRARANAFRTKETHLFMLGQKDHGTWNGDAKGMMADWAVDRGFDDSACVGGEEASTQGVEEGWQTASEGGYSDSAVFFSTDSKSSSSDSPRSGGEPML